MSATAPKSFANENVFRAWIIEQIRASLGNGWIVLDSKNVSDILVSRQETTHPVLAFIEVKYRKMNHGRIGFGGQKGSGFQPEILLQRPAYLERNMRWVIGHEGLNKCLFLDNDQIRSHCAGDVVSKTKQNNLSNGIFKELSSRQIDTDAVVEEVVEWLKTL